jgi:hypothetical protein
MSVDDRENDDVLDAVADLRTHDVSRRRADRLRRRYHALLQPQPERMVPVGVMIDTLVRRVIGPALAGAWCLAYLAEIIRRAAAIHGF